MNGHTNIITQGSSINVYAQKNEPSKKDGIWIKLEKQYGDNTFTELTNGWPKQQYYQLGEYNGNLYLFTENKVYKYNIDEDTCTELDNLSFNANYGKGTNIDNNFYIFSSSNSFYKYDVLNKTVTQLSNTTFATRYAPSSDGTSIYFLQGNGTTCKDIFQYNISSNTYTATGSAIMYAVSSDVCSSVIYDNKYYIFYQYYNSGIRYENAIYKINDTNPSTLTDVVSIYYKPIDISTIGKLSYIFSNSNVYAFNLDTRESISKNNIPYSSSSTSKVTCNYNDSIYIAYGYYNSSNQWEYHSLRMDFDITDIDKIDYDNVIIDNNSIFNTNPTTSLSRISTTMLSMFASTSTIPLTVSVDNTIYAIPRNDSQTNNTWSITNDVEQTNYSYNTIYVMGKYKNKVVVLDNSYKIKILFGEQLVDASNTGISNIGFAIRINNDIYFFGSTSSKKVDTSNNTISSLATIPFSFDGQRIVNDNEYLYMFSGNNACKYDIKNNTYTNLTSPSNINSTYGSVYITGKYIYLANNTGDTYRYDMINQTYTSVFAAPISNSGYYNKFACFVNNDLLFYTYYNNGSKTWAYKGTVEQSFETNSIYIDKSNPTQDTKLLDTCTISLKDAFYSDDNYKRAEYKTYIGDGTNWNLIE